MTTIRTKNRTIRTFFIALLILSTIVGVRYALFPHNVNATTLQYMTERNLVMHAGSEQDITLTVKSDDFKNMTVTIQSSSPSITTTHEIKSSNVDLQQVHIKIKTDPTIKPGTYTIVATIQENIDKTHQTTTGTSINYGFKIPIIINVLNKKYDSLAIAILQNIKANINVETPIWQIPFQGATVRISITNNSPYTFEPHIILKAFTNDNTMKELLTKRLEKTKQLNPRETYSTDIKIDPKTIFKNLFTGIMLKAKVYTTFGSETIPVSSVIDLKMIWIGGIVVLMGVIGVGGVLAKRLYQLSRHLYRRFAKTPL